MGSYGALWQARVDMMRPANGVMVIVAVWLGMAYALATPGGTVGAALLAPARFGATWYLAPLAAFWIAGFGNVLNDIVDHKIDRRAHPARPLPSGRLNSRQAQGWAAVTLALGLFFAVRASNAIFLFAVVNAGLLALYEFRFKRWPVIGNLVIAVLVASAFAFGAIAVAPVASLQASSLWWIMLMVALVNVAREILKDLEDADADTNRRTLPQVIGATASAWTASTLVGVAVGIDAFLVWSRADWTPHGRIVLAIAGLAFIVASGTGCYQAGRGQRALKWAMLVALAGLALALP